MRPFVLVVPSSRGLSLALTKHYLRTTNLAVVASHRSSNPDEIKHRIISDLPDVDPNRLHLLHVELNSEGSVARAANFLSQTLGAGESNQGAYIHTAFFTGGILHPERQPADLDAQHINNTFSTNVISHLLLIKHFSRFLPPPSRTNNSNEDAPLAKWVHVTARVGSVSDNRLGGWYSYRASKAALNQVVRTFDIQLAAKKVPAICVGVHPGTVKTDLSKAFWGSVEDGKLFEPEYAAQCLADVVGKLTKEQRGRVWDWKGDEVKP